MTDDSDLALPKIVDFGLTKLIGPSESTNEPFGTLGYIAPEVLTKQNYTFSCDLWSLGCILHSLLGGNLPFDHTDEAEAIRRTLEDQVDLSGKKWKYVS